MLRSAGAVGADNGVRVTRQGNGPVPGVALISMTGQRCTLDGELARAYPLVLNFVFTTCSSTCSAQTAVLAQVQRARRARGGRLQLASITIDPDNDTPEQLQQFARRFGITEGWQFYTGQFDDLLRIQQHFDVYRGAKSAHPPVLLLRASAKSPWVRVEGFPTPAELLTLIDGLPQGA